MCRLWYYIDEGLNFGIENADKSKESNKQKKRFVDAVSDHLCQEK